MVSVKFKCVQSGNVFEFHSEHDVKTMRTHPGYVEVVPTVEVKVEEQQEEPVKRTAGRPRKVSEEE